MCRSLITPGEGGRFTWLEYIVKQVSFSVPTDPLISILPRTILRGRLAVADFSMTACEVTVEKFVQVKLQFLLSRPSAWNRNILFPGVKWVNAFAKGVSPLTTNRVGRWLWKFLGHPVWCLTLNCEWVLRRAVVPDTEAAPLEPSTPDSTTVISLKQHPTLMNPS